MEYTSVEQVKLGQWVTYCCEEDMFQITTEAELQQVRETVADCLDEIDPEAMLCYEFWEDELSALVEIRSRYRPRPGDTRPDPSITKLDRRIARLRE